MVQLAKYPTCSKDSAPCWHVHVNIMPCLPGNRQHIQTTCRYRSRKVPACQQACSPFAPSKAESWAQYCQLLSYVYATSAVSSNLPKCLTITKHPKTKFPQIPITRKSNWHEAGECQSLPISWHIISISWQDLGRPYHASAISWGSLGTSSQHLGNILAYPGICLAFSVVKCLGDFLDICCISWHTFAKLCISLNRLPISSISYHCLVVLYLGIF